MLITSTVQHQINVSQGSTKLLFGIKFAMLVKYIPVVTFPAKKNNDKNNNKYKKKKKW